MKKFSVDLEESLYIDMKVRCAENGWLMKDFVAEAIQEKLNKKSSKEK